MNMVGKAGSTSVLLGDALRRPLAELELGGVKAGLSSLLKAVTQVLCPAYAYTHTQRGSSAPVTELWTESRRAFMLCLVVSSTSICCCTALDGIGTLA